MCLNEKTFKVFLLTTSVLCVLFLISDLQRGFIEGIPAKTQPSFHLTDTHKRRDTMTGQGANELTPRKSAQNELNELTKEHLGKSGVNDVASGGSTMFEETMAMFMEGLRRGETHDDFARKMKV